MDVSVIVAVRNGASTLSQCIDSVLAQTGCTVELIVVDGMSTDATAEIVSGYGDRVTYSIREPDVGIYDAWNKALRVATGQWCAFLGADDYLRFNNSLAILRERGGEHDGAATYVHGGVLRVGGSCDYVIHPEPADPLRHLRSGRMLPHPGSLHRLDALRNIGGFDASYRICGDFVAVLQLATYGEVIRCPEVTTATRIGGISNNWSMMRTSAHEKFRALRTHVGFSAAVRRQVIHRWPQVVGRAIETLTLVIFGPKVGLALLLRLRQCLKRPPKLI